MADEVLSREEQEKLAEKCMKIERELLGGKYAEYVRLIEQLDEKLTGKKFTRYVPCRMLRQDIRGSALP